MRITFLLPGLGGSGGPRSIYRHMTNLVDDGHEVFLQLPSQTIRWKSNSYTELEVWLDNPPKSVPGYQPDFEYISPRSFQESPHFWDVDPAVIPFLPNYPGDPEHKEREIVVASAFTTAHAAFTIAHLYHNVDAYYYMQHMETNQCPDLQHELLCLSSYGLPMQLIANSSWLRKKVEALNGRKDLEQIFHAVHNPQNFDGAGDFSKFRYPQKIKIVSYCDTRGFKGWHTALEVIEKLPPEAWEKIEWHTYGQKDEQIANKPIFQHGRLNHQQLGKLFNDCHVMLLYSVEESWAIFPMEGMLAGTLLLGNNVGNDDYLKPNHNFIEANTADEIVKKLGDLIHDLPKRENPFPMVTNGYADAQSYTWRESTNRLKEIFKC